MTLTSAAAPAHILQDAGWYWENDDKQWAPYVAANPARLEIQFTNKSDQGWVVIDSKSYKVRNIQKASYAGCYQISPSTSHRRRVFRFIPSSAATVFSDVWRRCPSTWDISVMESYYAPSLAPVLKSTEEYRRVETNFLITSTTHNRPSPYTIISIQRVQACSLWVRFVAKRDSMREGSNERTLYHGTSRGQIKAVIASGFDHSFRGGQGNLCGNGVCFSARADYAGLDNFSPPDAHGIKSMFIAQVLLGETTVGNSTMKITPRRGGSDKRRFDSTTNSFSNPTMYCVFRANQVFPSYLINFLKA